MVRKGSLKSRIFTDELNVLALDGAKGADAGRMKIQKEQKQLERLKDHSFYTTDEIRIK